MKLALSYAGFLTFAGIVLFGVLFAVLRYLPDDNLVIAGNGSFVPNRGDLLEVALPLSAGGVTFLALTGLVGGWFLAGRMLRPLDRISAAAAAAARGSLTHRVALEGRGDELRQLADTFDQMLARLQAAFEEQSRFAANASHELRTPQTVIKTMLEVARSDPRRVDVATLLTRLSEVNERSITTVDALLLLGRLEHGDLQQERCDLADVTGDALSLVLASAGPVDVRMEADLEPAPMDGNPVLLTQLVVNLVRNALIHNLPTGGTAKVTVTLDDTGRPVLTVTSTGASLSPEITRTLTEPFVRAQGRTRPVDGPRGSGLGLAIVSSIARAHGADLALTARPDGGLTAAVRFPRPGRPLPTR